jgi:hypothetical protein
MLRISCDKTGQARFARVPRWRPLEGARFDLTRLSARMNRTFFGLPNGKAKAGAGIGR